MVMLVTSVITTLCTAGVAFYLRFLFALCKECTPRWLNYRNPARLRLEEKSTSKRLPFKTRHSHAALQISEIPLNKNFHELRRDRA
jgi:hypothetical protein